MEWSAKNVLISNAIVVTVLVVSFLMLRRAPKVPVKLELRDEDHVAADSARPVKVVPLGASNYTPRVRKPQVQVLTTASRPLNVYFMWNGHSWDAYEVLGIPGGSEPPVAVIAYERAAALADKETLPFLQAALSAINGVISKS